MTNKFENMSADEIVDELLYIEAGASHVDAAFEDLKALDAGVRKNVVNELEKALIEETAEGAEMFKMFGPMLEALGDAVNAPEALTQEDKEDIAAVQSLSQTFNNIEKIKGAAAHPVTKAVVKEVAKLTPAQYNSPNLELETAIFKGYEKGIAAAAKPVPKKPKGPGSAL